MGGANFSTNFRMNCADWEKLYEAATPAQQEEIRSIEISPDKIYAAPVTGAEQNIGFANEHDFYLPYFTGANNAGCGFCAGDGTPDEKLKFGIEAAHTLKTKAAFFIKPYPIDKMIERGLWTVDDAKIIGTDIDAYNILTMRNLVHLEKPTPSSIAEFKKHFSVPFAIKGVFTDDDIELVKNAHPEIAYISNHGGRVETRTGSTADFLAAHAKELRSHCDELWVDGGIRTRRDIQTALFYGATRVAIGRPLITALISGSDVATDGVECMTAKLHEFIG